MHLVQLYDLCNSKRTMCARQVDAHMCANLTLHINCALNSCMTLHNKILKNVPPTCSTTHLQHGRAKRYLWLNLDLNGFAPRTNEYKHTYFRHQHHHHHLQSLRRRERESSHSRWDTLFAIQWLVNIVDWHLAGIQHPNTILLQHPPQHSSIRYSICLWYSFHAFSTDNGQMQKSHREWREAGAMEVHRMLWYRAPWDFLQWRLSLFVIGRNEFNFIAPINY